MFTSLATLLRSTRDLLVHQPAIKVALAVSALTAPAVVRSESQPDPVAILEAVRLAAANREVTLSGQLREKNQTLPFDLIAGGGKVQYVFKSHAMTVALDLSSDRPRLLLSEGGGQFSPIDPQRKLPKLDVEVGELALDFLYWKDARIEREEIILGQPCWLIRLTAPDRDSRYCVVFVWIAKSSGALMRIHGHNWAGDLTRRFLVVSARKSSIGWILKQMRIQHIDEKGATTRRLYLEIDGVVDN